ncbi:MAG TPA: aminodeoxychorismate lyase [Arenimonas sp.]|nr:aminodeoxychorismate lyase [Arenimonas sp.]
MSVLAVYRGRQRIDALDPLDRGLAYGDGLFETMRVHHGQVPWWSRHWARLARGAERLRISLPDESFVRGEAQRLLGGCVEGVFKLILTRGSGGRGYAPPVGSAPTLVLARHPLPSPAPTEGLRLRWCELRLSSQPMLAGLKHLNRLEQVLARAEWDHADVHEGLMCDAQDHVICATAANVFARIDRRWITPRLDHCGVQGVLREWLLQQGVVEEALLSRAMLESSEALFLGNAVRGILPVSRLGERVWPPSPAIVALQAQLASAVPMFAGVEDLS